MPRATTTPGQGDLPIRRNTLLLAGSLTVFSGSIQLVAAISSLTFVLVTGVEGLLGLGPAIFLTAAALTAPFAGRAMDRFGRIPVLAVACLGGIAGGVLTGAGARVTSSVAVIIGFAVIGAASGTITLGTRTAAGDMYPVERRGRGIALVLSGAVFGAILGPAVFSPLFDDVELAANKLMIPWFAGAGFMLAALVLILCVRPDPKWIAEQIASRADEAPAGQAAPLRELLRRPGVIPAMLAAVASFSVMVAVMNLAGYFVVHDHHHHQQSIFPIIGAHVLGMYALILVIGSLIDRYGRRRPLIGGLALMGLSCIGLLWVESVWGTAVLLFGLGVGWNLSFVAATAELIDRTSPVERGRLLGFSDLLSGLTGAGLALLGGFALQALGVAAIAIGATVLVVVPSLWILRMAGTRSAPLLRSQTVEADAGPPSL
jgi:MFS family permease